MYQGQQPQSMYSGSPSMDTDMTSTAGYTLSGPGGGQGGHADYQQQQQYLQEQQQQLAAGKINHNPSD
jgi:hypothetical protein